MQDSNRPADPGAITEEDLKNLREALDEYILNEYGAERQVAPAEQGAQVTAEQQGSTPGQAEHTEKSPQTD